MVLLRRPFLSFPWYHLCSRDWMKYNATFVFLVVFVGVWGGFGGVFFGLWGSFFLFVLGVFGGVFEASNDPPPHFLFFPDHEVRTRTTFFCRKTFSEEKLYFPFIIHGPLFPFSFHRGFMEGFIVLFYSHMAFCIEGPKVGAGAAVVPCLPFFFTPSVRFGRNFL